jgi:hypothetical protein
VQDVGADLRGHERQAGLLPRQPAGRWAMAAGAAMTSAGAGHPAVALGVGALADDGEVGAAGGERASRPST